MAVTIGFGLAALSAGATYSQNRTAASRQKAAAEAARIEASNDAAANRQAAMAADERDKTAALVKQNEAQATDQLTAVPEVTIADAQTPAQRKRVVSAQFNVGDAGVGSAGGLRV